MDENKNKIETLEIIKIDLFLKTREDQTALLTGLTEKEAKLNHAMINNVHKFLESKSIKSKKIPLKITIKDEKDEEKELTWYFIEKKGKIPFTFTIIRGTDAGDNRPIRKLNFLTNDGSLFSIKTMTNGFLINTLSSIEL